jgi:hypothetical protein
MVQFGVNGFCNYATQNDTNGVIVHNNQYITEMIYRDALGKTRTFIQEITEGQSLTQIVKYYKKAEKRLLLTFFLGFYVSFLLARWWQQVSAVPKLDDLLRALNSNIKLTQSERDNGDNLKMEKEFKNKVVRYCLLAMALRFSDLSSRVRRSFVSKDDYIKKGLLSSDEYDTLSETGLFTLVKNIDGIASRWFIPLNWSATLLRDEGMDENSFLLAEHKFLVKEIAGIQTRLLGLSYFKHYHMPGIMIQAITIVVVVYFTLGLIASQGTVTCNAKDPGGTSASLFAALAMNFPFFQVLKYLLLITWFQVAKYLNNPFGHDRYIASQLYFY